MCQLIRGHYKMNKLKEINLNTNININIVHFLTL